MNKNKLIAVSMLAAAMLAACGGDGSDYAAKLRGDKPTPAAQPTSTPAYQTELQAPTQTPAYIISTQVVQVVVTSTPEPGIEQPCDYVAIDAPMDAADKGVGVVRRGYMTACAMATAQAMGVLPGGK